jgi:hypothetical protein
MTMTSITRTLSLAALLVGLTLPAAAQISTGTVLGTVKDAQGVRAIGLVAN